MDFPYDIKLCIKDCILSIIWPKKGIRNFFKSNQCLDSDLQCIANDNQLSRNAMIDLVFDKLASRADKGLGQFRAMLHSLINWSAFDSYYFDELKKLDRRRADENLMRLRTLQEVRDAEIKKKRTEREIKLQAEQKPEKELKDLLNSYLILSTSEVKPQQRGYELEKILLGLAKLSSLEVTTPFRVVGEQIDGSIKYDGEHYIIEAKWQAKQLTNEAVYQLVGKIEGKMYGRGIFVSVHGFSEDVLVAVTKGKALKTIFVDGEDLILVLEGHLSLCKMIDVKVKAAQTKGWIYVHPIMGNSKIPNV